MNIPLYQKIYDDLRHKIESNTYEKNTYLPTDKELEEFYNVSNITIKKAMDLLKNDGFVSRKPKKGTLIVRNQKKEKVLAKRRNLWGVVITDFTDYFGTEIVKTIMQDNQHDFVFKVSYGDENREERLIDELMSIGIEGLILLPCSSQYYSSKLLELSTGNFPVVVIDRIMHSIPICSVQSDSNSAAKDLTNYLFEHGHKNIGIITSDNQISTIDQRVSGFISAHLESGNSILQSQILSSIDSVVPSSQKPRKEDIDEIITFLTDNPNLSAIIATEYNIALLIKSALSKIGKEIPADISLVCFDNYDTDNCIDNDLHLTYIKQDQQEISRQAIRLIEHKLKDPDLIEKISVGYELVEGNSVKDLS